MTYDDRLKDFLRRAFAENGPFCGPFFPYLAGANDTINGAREKMGIPDSTTPSPADVTQSMRKRVEMEYNAGDISNYAYQIRVQELKGLDQAILRLVNDADFKLRVAATEKSNLEIRLADMSELREADRKSYNAGIDQHNREIRTRNDRIAEQAAIIEQRRAEKISTNLAHKKALEDVDKFSELQHLAIEKLEARLQKEQNANAALKTDTERLRAGLAKSLSAEARALNIAKDLRTELMNAGREFKWCQMCDEWHLQPEAGRMTDSQIEQESLHTQAARDVADVQEILEEANRGWGLTAKAEWVDPGNHEFPKPGQVQMLGENGPKWVDPPQPEQTWTSDWDVLQLAHSAGGDAKDVTARATTYREWIINNQTEAGQQS